MSSIAAFICLCISAIAFLLLIYLRTNKKQTTKELIKILPTSSFWATRGETYFEINARENTITISNSETQNRIVLELSLITKR